jgi:hypothetical protein
MSGGEIHFHNARARDGGEGMAYQIFDINGLKARRRNRTPVDGISFLLDETTDAKRGSPPYRGRTFNVRQSPIVLS